MAKILIFGGYAKSLTNFRGELIKDMVRLGHQVIGMAPETGFEGELNAIGAQYQRVPLQRTGLNPLKDLAALRLLVKEFRQMQPDILLSYTIKPVIYGSLAARAAGVPRVYSMITGLGYAFAGRSLKQKLLLSLVRILYSQSLRKNARVFFQNPDDIAVFRKFHLLPNGDSAVLINGSGVDIRKFSFVKAKTNPVIFLLMARLIREKGIAEYVEAARLLKPRFPEARFQILGPPDSNPSAIRQEEIAAWQSEGIVEYLGQTNDVRPYISECSVFVLPSFYPEGTPRSILEAMSMGRPVITTDAPGCRETVRRNMNGFLVPVKDSLALADAMERFIVNPSLVTEMGIRSRVTAEEKYDVRKVNRSILEAMDLLEVGRSCVQQN
ncbi:glycosyltransferase family 4 protein [Pelotomaculum propionicicum]|uniref:glycosyltransferase family 4 protein n=1 Tax=Pelotomaculum propionicicum TaxID=258475 RepID=UPI003B7BC402